MFRHDKSDIEAFQVSLTIISFNNSEVNLILIFKKKILTNGTRMELGFSLNSDDKRWQVWA